MAVKRFFQIRPLAFLLLLLWIAGCGPKLQAPSSDIVIQLDTADFNTVLEIVDVSDPAKPVKVSETALPSKPEYYSSITVWKQFVLATTAYGLHLLDVANPAVPKLLWNLPLETLSGEAVIFKDYAVFPTRKGLYVLDLKNPLEPQWVFHAGHKGAEIRSHLIDLKIKGNYAYAHDVYYLHVFDISQPEQPKLVNSYAIPSRSLFLFRALGEQAEPIQQPNFASLTDTIRFFNLNPFRPLSLNPFDLPSSFSNQLSDWNNLLELSANVVKVHLSPQYLCWLYLDYDYLWVLPSKGDRIYPLDLVPAYIKYQYNSGIKKRPKPGDVTDIIKVNYNTLYVISQDKWMKTVKIDRGEWGRITDFQISAGRIYILRENGVLFIAELSTTEGLNGVGTLENLSQSSQHLTVDKNFVYLLSHQESPSQGQ